MRDLYIKNEEYHLQVVYYAEDDGFYHKPC